MSLAWREGDALLDAWPGLTQVVVEQVDGVVQIIVVRLADPDAQLALEPRRQAGQFFSSTSRKSYCFQCSSTLRSIWPVTPSQSGLGSPSAPRGPNTAFQQHQSRPDSSQRLPQPSTRSS